MTILWGLCSVTGNYSNLREISLWLDCLQSSYVTCHLMAFWVCVFWCKRERSNLLSVEFLDKRRSSLSVPVPPTLLTVHMTWMIRVHKSKHRDVDWAMPTWKVEWNDGAVVREHLSKKLCTDVSNVVVRHADGCQWLVLAEPLRELFDVLWPQAAVFQRERCDAAFWVFQ